MNNPSNHLSNTAVFTLRLALIVGVLAVWELLAHYKVIDTFFTSQPTAIIVDMKNAFVKALI